MLSEYFLKSKSLFYSLLVTLPLFILYEVGIFYMFQADVPYVKNGADVLIEEFIKMIGLNGYYAASSIFILVLFIVLISHKSQSEVSLNIAGRKKQGFEPIHLDQ